MCNSYYTLPKGECEHGKSSPLARDYPFYIPIEAMGTDQKQDSGNFTAIRERAFEQGLIVDAVIAKPQRERDELWETGVNILSFLEWFPVFIYDVSQAIPDMDGRCRADQTR